MNLPNKLSLGRILMVPVIVLFSLFANLGEAFALSVNGYEISMQWQEVIVVVLFIIASITDMLDGMIARKYNMITSFGKFIDPIADKMLVNSLLILYAYHGFIPVLAVVIMIWRDTIVDGLRMSASSRGKVVAAGMMGKIKTVLQMIAIVLVMIHNVPFAFLGIPMDQIMIWAACAVSVISGVQYFLQLKDVVMETM